MEAQQTVKFAFMLVIFIRWETLANTHYDHQSTKIVDIGRRYFILGSYPNTKVEEFDPFTKAWKTGYPDIKRGRNGEFGVTAVPAAKFKNCQSK